LIDKIHNSHASNKCIATLAGIEHYFWCLGTKPGYCDKITYVETTEVEASSVPHGDLKLRDGHPVYVTVQVTQR